MLYPFCNKYHITRFLLCNLAQLFERSEKPCRLHSSISKYTDTDKNVSILSVSFVALRYASTFTSFRQTTSAFWTFLKGLFGRPSKICNIALAITLSKSTWRQLLKKVFLWKHWEMYYFHFPPPLSEQKRIVAKIADLFKLINSIQNNL